MIRLLLDEHISPAVARSLRRRTPPVEAYALAEWEGGRLLGQDDAVCLGEAAENGLVFVTYDLRTIPTLLRRWADEGRAHGGVILIDNKTISPAATGRLVRALSKICAEMGKMEWVGRVVFLRRVR
jgi:hypothetical protein